MRQTLRSELRALAVVALLLLPTTSLHAQQPSTTNATIEAQLRQAIHEYDDALRRADVALAVVAVI